MAFSLKSFFNIRQSPKEYVPTPRRAIGFSAGVTVDHDTAMKISAMHRGITYISTQVAKLPWQIKDSGNNILEGSLSNLLDLAPNSEMNAFSFRLLMIQNAIIYGNAYAEIERDLAGRPVALWPIPSKSVEVTRDIEGKLIYKINSGSFSNPTTSIILKPDDVFHLKNFHTKDGIVGQGIVAYGASALGIALAADQMAGNLFANGGIPSGVLEVPGTMEEEAFARVKASWDENHKGKKSGGIAILEEGMKFNAVNMSPDIMQFLESRKFGVLEIARFLGLPPTKLFDTDASTFNNQENSNLEVATDTLDSWCRNLEMEADIKILKYRYNGRRTEIDLYQVFRGDMESRANYFSKMMQTASLTPNEIRQKEGLPKYSDGDRYFVAVNNYSPADRIDEIIDSQISKNEEPAKAATPATPQTETTQASSTLQDDLSKAALKFLEGK